jgi:catechol 2,3-dioxygenase-like lactoylglutathione lyase family enzyme
MIERLEHVALSVGDLDRSIAFYSGVLGFTVARVLDCAPPMPLGQINRMPNSAARIAHLECGSGMLELFEYNVPRGRPLPQAGMAARTQADHGLIHFGLKTDDVHADYARLREAGVAFWSEPIEFRPGAWVVYFSGPDGETLELRQT